MLKNLLHKSLASKSALNLFPLMPYRGFAAKTVAASQITRDNSDEGSSVTLADITGPLQSLESLKDFISTTREGVFEQAYGNVDLNNEVVPALKKYKELGFNKKQLAFLMNRVYDSLRVNSQSDKLNIVSLSKIAQEKYKLDEKGIRSLILRAPKLFDLTAQELESNINYLKTTFGFNDDFINYLLTKFSVTLSQSQLRTKEVEKAFEEYLNIKGKELGDLFVKYPYLIAVEPEYLRGNFKVLYTHHFTRKNIIQILQTEGEFLALKPKALETVFHLPKKLGLLADLTAKIMTENPKLLNICGTAIMPLKYKLFSKYNLSDEVMARMFVNHPRVWVKSVGSNTLKLKYLVQQMKISPLREPAFPGILEYSYAKVIRPRGELMLRTNNLLPWTEVLNLTDQEFVNKIGKTVEDLEKIKAEYVDNNNELDYKYRFFTRYISNRPTNEVY